MNKVYVAGRTSRISEILALYDWLEINGFELAFDWAREEEGIVPPFRNSNNELIQVKMKKELEAAADADIFILLSDSGIRGAYIELGAFLHSALNHPNKVAYVVGGANIEYSFEALEVFRFIDSITELKRSLQDLSPQ